jgi:thiol-disulfide isomerase/thioredoxin
MTPLKKILLLVVAVAGSTPAMSQNKPRTFSDNGKVYKYSDTGGVTASYIAHFGDKFAVDSFTTPGGEMLTMSPDRQVKVYNFWFVACKPCVAEIPALNRLVEKYRHDSVEFIAITFDNAERISNFLKDKRFDFMIGILPMRAINHIKKIDFYPFTAIVNKKQKLSFVLTGRPIGKDSEKEVFEILDPQIQKALQQ